MIRSALALVAAVWFAVNAASFLPVPFVYPNEGQAGGIDGDAVEAARALCSQVHRRGHAGVPPPPAARRDSSSTTLFVG